MEKFLLRLEVGHESVMLEPPLQAEPCAHTHRWTVFVRVANSVACENKLIEKVIFQLHEDFKCSRRVLMTPPFEVTETGYAGFVIPIFVYFAHCKREYHFEYDMNLRYVPQDRVRIIEPIEFKDPKPALRKLLMLAKAELITSPRAKMLPLPSSNVVSNSFYDLFCEPLHVGGLEKGKVSKSSTEGYKFMWPNGKAIGKADQVRLSGEKATSPPKVAPQQGATADSSASGTVFSNDSPTKLKLRISHLKMDNVEKNRRKKRRRKAENSLDSSEGSGRTLVSSYDCCKSAGGGTAATDEADEIGSVDSVYSIPQLSTPVTPSHCAFPLPSCSSGTVPTAAASSSSTIKKRGPSRALLLRLRDKISALDDPNIAQRVADIIAQHGQFDVVANFLQFDLSTLNSQSIELLNSCLKSN